MMKFQYILSFIVKYAILHLKKIILCLECKFTDQLNRQLLLTS